MKARIRLSRALIGIAILSLPLALICLMIRQQEDDRRGFERSACVYRLKDFIIGIHTYAEHHATLPPASANPHLPVGKSLGWITAVVPYTIHEACPTNLDATFPWDSPTNLGPWPTPSLDYLAHCPADRRTKPGASRPSPSSFVGLAGVGIDAPDLPKGDPRAGVFGYTRTITLADIKDGTTNTACITETTRQNGPWTASGPSTVRGVDTHEQPYIGKGRQFGGNHACRREDRCEGVNVAFLDGSVRFIHATISPRTFDAMTTIAGHENSGGHDPY